MTYEEMRIPRRFSILAEEEREYLSAVLATYKERYGSSNITVEKMGSLGDYHIHICTYSGNKKDVDMYLPNVLRGKGNYYKGMEPNKEYTPEELGL